MNRQTAVDAVPVAQVQQLPRRLGLWSSIGIAIGITIGSGIFRTPADIATLVPNPTLMLGLWALGGAITLCGALSVAELAAALPETGGIYAYLREGWGRPFAFLFGWSELVLIRATALGGIAVVFGQYFLRSIGIDPVAHGTVANCVSAGAIVFAATVNIVGVRLGAAIVGISTAAKFVALSGLVLVSFIFGGAHGASLAHFFGAGSAPVQAGSFGLALVSVLWAYDGFADISFAGGEVENPQRNLPRALVLGTLAIIVIYLLANAAYLYVIPIRAMANSPLVAADTMLPLFGTLGVALVSVMVMISSFSSLNGTMLASPRIFFAMATDGLFFPKIAKVHPRYKTPYVAIALAAILGVALVLTQSFTQLTQTFVLAIWPFYALSVGAVFRLRRRRPDLKRPYHVAGYPVVPLIFQLGVLYFVINKFITQPLSTSVVFALILAGLPVYSLFFRNRAA